MKYCSTDWPIVWGNLSISLNGSLVLILDDYLECAFWLWAVVVAFVVRAIGNFKIMAKFMTTGWAF